MKHAGKYRPRSCIRQSVRIVASVSRNDDGLGFLRARLCI